MLLLLLYVTRSLYYYCVTLWHASLENIRLHYSSTDSLSGDLLVLWCWRLSLYWESCGPECLQSARPTTAVIASPDSPPTQHQPPSSSARRPHGDHCGDRNLLTRGNYPGLDNGLSVGWDLLLLKLLNPFPEIQSARFSEEVDRNVIGFSPTRDTPTCSVQISAASIIQFYSSKHLERPKWELFQDCCQTAARPF